MLLIQPDKGWLTIKEAAYNPKQVYGYYLLPMLFLSSLASVLFVGKNFEQVTLSPNQLFLINFISFAAAIYGSGFLIASLAPRFKGISSSDYAITLIAFAYIPVFLASMLSVIHPSLQIINLVAVIYMIFLFAKGSRILMEVPDQKHIGFTVVSLIILFLMRILLSVFITALLGGGNTMS
ncbi:MAG: YIP1 family protein [Bacteroidota bacterium]